ncbi:hypothetical protein [Streptomyces sp. SD15]
MSEHAVAGSTERTNVSWDLGVGLLSVVADDAEPETVDCRSAQIGFASRVWISLDASGRPVALDILDVPPILVGIVPSARRGGPVADLESSPPGAIPWLLDTDSDWMWVELIRAPVRQRLEREGWVELRLTGNRPTRLKVRAPVAGVPDQAGRAR